MAAVLVFDLVDRAFDLISEHFQGFDNQMLSDNVIDRVTSTFRFLSRNGRLFPQTEPPKILVDEIARNLTLAH
jgi:hypothetical protein